MRVYCILLGLSATVFVLAGAVSIWANGKAFKEYSAECREKGGLPARGDASFRCDFPPKESPR